MNKPLVYLAGPYSHKSSRVRKQREKMHCKVAMDLIRQGHSVYAPIAETTALSKHGKFNDTGWGFWRQKDLTQLGKSDEMWILTIPGWKESVGVRGEVKFCLKNKIPMKLVDQDAGQNSGFNFRLVNKRMVLQIFDVECVDELND